MNAMYVDVPAGSAQPHVGLYLVTEGVRGCNSAYFVRSFRKVVHRAHRPTQRYALTVDRASVEEAVASKDFWTVHWYPRKRKA